MKSLTTTTPERSIRAEALNVVGEYVGGSCRGAAGRALCGTPRQEAENFSPCAKQRAQAPVVQPGERHPGTQQELRAWGEKQDSCLPGLEQQLEE